MLGGAEKTFKYTNGNEELKENINITTISISIDFNELEMEINLFNDIKLGKIELDMNDFTLTKEQYESIKNIVQNENKKKNLKI